VSLREKPKNVKDWRGPFLEEEIPNILGVMITSIDSLTSMVPSLMFSVWAQIHSLGTEC
jgi:hypothetical protein